MRLTVSTPATKPGCEGNRRTSPGHSCRRRGARPGAAPGATTVRRMLPRNARKLARVRSGIHLLPVSHVPPCCALCASTYAGGCTARRGRLGGRLAATTPTPFPSPSLLLTGSWQPARRGQRRGVRLRPSSTRWLAGQRRSGGLAARGARGSSSLVQRSGQGAVEAPVTSSSTGSRSERAA